MLKSQHDEDGTPLPPAIPSLPPGNAQESLSQVLQGLDGIKTPCGHSPSHHHRVGNEHGRGVVTGPSSHGIPDPSSPQLQGGEEGAGEGSQRDLGGTGGSGGGTPKLSLFLPGPGELTQCGGACGCFPGQGDRKEKASSGHSLTFLHFLLLITFSGSQEGEDDPCLGVDAHGSHHHPARALHHVGTCQGRDTMGTQSESQFPPHRTPDWSGFAGHDRDDIGTQGESQFPPHRPQTGLALQGMAGMS